MSIKSLVKQVLTEKENRKYEKRLADCKVSYEEWLREQERYWREENCGKCTEGGGTSFVLVIASKGKLTDYAVKNIKFYFNKNPDVSVVYGDEDVREEDGKPGNPWFKPDWSPDFLDSCLYFGSLLAVRKNHWEKVHTLYDSICPGQWRSLFGEDAGKGAGKGAGKDAGKDIGNEVYTVTDLEAYEKWIFYLTEDACRKGSGMVGHIPQILFHASSAGEQARFLTETSGMREHRQRLMKTFLDYYVNGKNACSPLVSVIIPSKDQPYILKQCIEGVRMAGADIPCEILLVDNGSSPENRAKVEDMVQEEMKLAMNGREVPIRYFYEPMEFNFSRMCNLGAERAKGKLLLFLNDDVELCEPGCIGEMAARAMRAYTGAVGMKLLYPDSGCIQHAGITNLPMGPVHKLQFQTDDRDYYGKTNHSCRNFLAVTAACLMVEADKFREAGGFSEELRVAFNDVELCFRLYELGYHNVCLNDIYAYHHESLSRGADESEEKLKRLLDERDRLYRKHPGLEGTDPYYSVHLNREGLDTRICPAYETAGNCVQKAEVPLKQVNTKGCRQDDCLMFRVEDGRERRIVGYGVVLGDNNACYEKILLLSRAGNTEGNVEGNTEGNTEEKQEKNTDETTAVYGVPLTEQYRPDLEENLPDQINVALCGFMIELQEGVVPEGIYRVGMLVRNRVTGGKLMNWSNRMVQL